MKQVHDEGIRQFAKYSRRPAFGRAECERAVGFVLEKIEQNLAEFSAGFPAPASKNHVYPVIDNVEWTSSFWTGMLWLAYELTGAESYRRAAEAQLPSYQRRIAERSHTDTHDLGFLYTLSAVAEYRNTANPVARQLALDAAAMLTERFFEKAGIIQAWGDLNDPEQRGRMIIDCCMNLPLLYWAARESGREEYRTMALSHARQAARYLVREDASTYHTFYMDVESGAPRFGKTAQGYSDNSCWARGQAWAIYGFALSYRYTRESEFPELNQKLANYFLNRLPEDDVCYWDLCFTAGDEERDSSAAAIAACGLLELAKELPLTNEYRICYENAALAMIRSLTESYTTAGLARSNGILRHAVYSKPAGEGVDECNIWGDYFYLEALVRLLRDWRLYW
ncbi:unsaturated chondroitin disaccharide hydrolase [Hydrogenispora ethanolica]|uniref:Unsaturated chondroitin disaccharide hydrolase n=1 Tax=Hydrogenispora ethanolica TaxID=1082276 RepID=A0A4R1RWH9_HYDET|nr:glycoside hydrolase family 88 protein [Hydrogenispora ethanolica]TCL70804.1 unsaturated chondroitin disaccharide hydrolase [Hydrogenispora ethanolica]